MPRHLERLVFRAQPFELEAEDSAGRGGRRRAGSRQQAPGRAPENPGQRPGHRPIVRAARAIDQLDEIAVELAFVDALEQFGRVLHLSAAGDAACRSSVVTGLEGFDLGAIVEQWAVHP